jgi:hypothetical protein
MTKIPHNLPGPGDLPGPPDEEELPDGYYERAVEALHDRIVELAWDLYNDDAYRNQMDGAEIEADLREGRDA